MASEATAVAPNSQINCARERLMRNSTMLICVLLCLAGITSKKNEVEPRVYGRPKFAS